MSGSAPASEELTLPSSAGAPSEVGRFTGLAWVTLAYTIAVILFGAWVRISGSGAGCGQHWPTCAGKVVPLPENVHMAIELTHRLTSGLDFLLVVGLAIGAFVRYPRGHLVRKAATLGAIFIFGEVVIGAVLVLLKLVAHDTSFARAVVMAAHLVNTCFLTGSLAVTAWASSGQRAFVERLGFGLGAALVGTLVVATLGAVTALGDTLFPVHTGQPLAARLAADQGATANLLERLRIVHPLSAVLVAAWLLFVSGMLAERHVEPEVLRAARLVSFLVIVQVAAGVVNIWLSAPGWLQVTHLGIAMLLWVALVLLSAATIAQPRAAE